MFEIIERFASRPEKLEVLDAYETITFARGDIASVNIRYLLRGEDETAANKLNDIYTNVIKAIETLNGILDKYGEPRIYYGDYSIEKVNALIDDFADSIMQRAEARERSSKV